MKKSGKTGAMLLALGLSVGLTLPAFAQDVTRKDAQAVFARVSQDVMHAQFSSTGYGNVQKEFTEGQEAYFKGDYATAVKKWESADRRVKNFPNDYHGEAPSK